MPILLLINFETLNNLLNSLACKRPKYFRSIKAKAKQFDLLAILAGMNWAGLVDIENFGTKVHLTLHEFNKNYSKLDEKSEKLVNFILL